MKLLWPPVFNSRHRASQPIMSHWDLISMLCMQIPSHGFTAKCHTPHKVAECFPTGRGVLSLLVEARAVHFWYAAYTLLKIRSSVKGQHFYDLLWQSNEHNPTLLSQPFVLLIQWLHSYIKHSWLTQALDHLRLCDTNTECMLVCAFLLFACVGAWIGFWKRKKKAPDLRRDFLIFLSLKWKRSNPPNPLLPQNTQSQIHSHAHTGTFSETLKGKDKALCFGSSGCSLSLTYLDDVIHTPGTRTWLATHMTTWRALTLPNNVSEQSFPADIYNKAQIMPQWVGRIEIIVHSSLWVM